MIGMLRMTKNQIAAGIDTGAIKDTPSGLMLSSPLGLFKIEQQPDDPICSMSGTVVGKFANQQIERKE